MTQKKNNSTSIPRSSLTPVPSSKRNGGGAPGPKFTIPCPPKPKK